MPKSRTVTFNMEDNAKELADGLLVWASETTEHGDVDSFQSVHIVMAINLAACSRKVEIVKRRETLTVECVEGQSEDYCEVTLTLDYTDCA